MTPEIREALRAVGTPVSFDDGDVLRHRGAFAPDMLLITSGTVACFVSDTSAPFSVGCDTIVGEIGFLTGQGATATLTALGPVQALSLDADALRRLQQDAPTIAADVLRHLARLLQSRSAENKSLLAGNASQETEEVEVMRCSTLDQQRIAQRVRYDVLCLEGGRISPFADDAEGIIADDLDRNGTAFVALQHGQAIGMMRVNFGRDWEDVMPDIYGIAGTGFPVADSAFVTATAIRATFRDDRTLRPLLDAIGTFAQAADAVALFTDCPPDAQPLYEAYGFARTGANYVNAEVGVSVPMVLNLSDRGD